VIQSVLQFFRDWFERFVAVQGIDRAMAIAAQSYSAFLPLVIVYSATLPRGENQDFADVIVNRFELHGATAASVRQAFAPSGAVESSLTVLGVVLLLVSTLSFTRGLQRMYEGAFALPTLGMRNTPRALTWLLIIGAVLALRPVVTEPFNGWLLTAVTLAMSTLLWLVTPYLRPVRLLPSALLAAIGMAGIGIWSVIYMPHALATSAAQYGVIGIGFAMLTWFVAVAAVLVVTTTGGATIADRWIKR
jgi:membrane protein